MVSTRFVGARAVTASYAAVAGSAQELPRRLGVENDQYGLPNGLTRPTAGQ